MIYGRDGVNITYAEFAKGYFSCRLILNCIFLHKIGLYSFICPESIRSVCWLLHRGGVGGLEHEDLERET